MKTFDKALSYFELTDSDDVWDYYNLREGFIASWKMDDITSLCVGKDGESFTVMSSERGTLEATKDAIANLSIYVMQEVY